MHEEAYSAVAEEQLDALERADPDASRDVILLCGLVFDHPERAHAMSSAITTDGGIVLRLAVPGRSPLKLFWTRDGAGDGAGDGPRIEAVLPHP
jgi:hypothetical protein